MEEYFKESQMLLEKLRANHIETAQKLAEAKILLTKLSAFLMILADTYLDENLCSFSEEIEEFLK